MRFPPSGIHCPTCHTLIPPPPASGATQTRLSQKKAQYATIGKKCGDCHAYKPTSEFFKNAGMPDGMQYTCRTCFELRARLCKIFDGGPAAWRAARDQLRATNDAANQAAGRP